MEKGSKSSQNDNFMGASTKQGYDIALKSRDIVKSLIGAKISHLPIEERIIIERIVHSTADVEYASLTKISSDFIQKSLESVKADKGILTDINMVKTGINKYGGPIDCYINHASTIKLSKTHGITRAASAMRIAAMEGFEGMVVIGNSPTALFEVIKLVENDEMNVESIVGVPVGFVGAAESKRRLHETDIPHLVTEGPKGGTPVAVAAINSLINISRNER